MIHVDRSHLPALDPSSSKDFLSDDIISWPPISHETDSIQDPFPSTVQVSGQPQSSVVDANTNTNITSQSGPGTPLVSAYPAPRPSPSSSISAQANGAGPAGTSAPVADSSSVRTDPAKGPAQESATKPDDTTAGSVTENAQRSTPKSLTLSSSPLSDLSQLSPAPEDDKPLEAESSSQAETSGGSQPESNSTGAKPTSGSPRSKTKASLSVEDKQAAGSSAIQRSTGSSSAPLSSGGATLTEPTAGANVTALAPSNAGASTSGTFSGDRRVNLMLDLNNQLLQVYLTCQSRGITHTDPILRPYAQRLLENIQWVQSFADPNAKVLPFPSLVPPPHLDFWPSNRIDRLYAALNLLDKDNSSQPDGLSSASSTTSSPLLNGGPMSSQTLKRERSVDDVGGTNNHNTPYKRRDTGESKAHLSSMPPPSTNPTTKEFSLPLANGHSQQTHSQQLSPRLGDTGGTDMAALNMARERERMRQIQLRQQHQQQQQQQQQMNLMNAARQMSSPNGATANTASGRRMSPPGSMGMPLNATGNNMSTTPSQMHPSGAGGAATAGGMNTNSMGGPMPPQLSSLPPHIQQLYRILQNPNHPLMQAIVQHIPNFSSLPVQMQLQQMMKFVQQQQQHQHRLQNQLNVQNLAQGGAGSASNLGQSPTAQNAGAQGLVNGMGAMHAGGMGSMGQNGMGGMGGMAQGSSGMMGQRGMPPAGMNMDSLAQHQRQMLMMQQMQRGAGGSGAGMASAPQMNPQQMMLIQQERMRQERLQQMQQQQHQQQQQQTGAPGMPQTMNMNGVMGGGPGDTNLAALRSNASISGIARNMPSPSDPMNMRPSSRGTSSPMTPRTPSAAATRGPPAGADDYQRMMMQQQQQQQQRMAHQNSFSPQAVQQSQQQQMASGSVYGMSQPSGGGYPGPSQSQQQQQQQQQQQMQPSGWPARHQQSQDFSSSYGTGMDNSFGQSNDAPYGSTANPNSGMHAPRHMSGTPVPQQPQMMQQQHPGSMGASGPQSASSDVAPDFDGMQFGTTW
ncbi:hypothetical protein FISHEDRAFT_76811 [Fistulina hepatica ATCC 64428]|uniref:Uncharacterized protein n=1 Tax=Fistulina hepatica ATCC 64428 TaxID=1128425 RepID=A0A0D7A422_9AGAR|nr:hypothetical protein FISHEDRAFT_76811 [Fistulina hepatica ATCC 64428]